MYLTNDNFNNEHLSSQNVYFDVIISYVLLHISVLDNTTKL